MISVRSFFLLLIRFYQVAVSPLFPSCCRYTPSCSAYTYEAVAKFGVCKGFYLGFKRILRCHPFHAGGYDPVPDSPKAAGQRNINCSKNPVFGTGSSPIKGN